MDIEELKRMLAGKTPTRMPSPVPRPGPLGQTKTAPPMPGPMGAVQAPGTSIGPSAPTTTPDREDIPFLPDWLEKALGMQAEGQVELARGYGELGTQALTGLAVAEGGAELAGGVPLAQVGVDQVRAATPYMYQGAFAQDLMDKILGRDEEPSAVSEVERVLEELPEPGQVFKDAFDAFNKIYKANPEIPFPARFELSKNAAQDSVGPMPTGYWVASGLIAEELAILLTFGLGRGLQATRLAAKTPKVLNIVGDKIPDAAKPFMRQAADAAGVTLKVVESTLKAPYRAEEAVGKAIGAGARLAGRNVGRIISPEPFRAGPEAATVIDVPSDFVPYEVQTARTIAKAEERAANEVMKTRAAVQKTRAEARGAEAAAKFDLSQQAARDANRASDIDDL